MSFALSISLSCADRFLLSATVNVAGSTASINLSIVSVDTSVICFDTMPSRTFDKSFKASSCEITSAERRIPRLLLIAS